MPRRVPKSRNVTDFIADIFGRAVEIGESILEFLTNAWPF